MAVDEVRAYIPMSIEQIIGSEFANVAELVEHAIHKRILTGDSSCEAS
jgi:hypothetical protein